MIFIISETNDCHFIRAVFNGPFARNNLHIAEIPSMKLVPLFDHELFTYCGQHCVICMVHKMKKKPCANCSGANCTGSIDKVEKSGDRICAEVKGNDFCKDCEKYPCRKLEKMDLAYRV